MQLLNLSAEPEWKLRSWLPPGLNAAKVVFFPDACPGRSPLPTGTATLLRRPDWRRFAVSDCGCGMRLLRSSVAIDALTARRWDAIAERLRSNKSQLGDLGGGNHFLDALEPYGEDVLYFLIHTGSRSESGLVDALVDQPSEFDREFKRIVQWARDNRAAIQEAVEQEFGRLDLVVDLPHNTSEALPDGSVVVRKGAVRVRPGETNVIPSHMGGDVVLVRATEAVSNALCSLSHGTGRTVPRGESKTYAEVYDFAALRKRILIPSGVSDASLRTEGPFAYRDLDECLTLLRGYVEVVERYAVVGYMGHLG
jgi:RNA-splicing ligase RtcB